MCMIDDAEQIDFCSQKTHKAKQQHTCSECKRTINVGERYEYSTVKCKGVPGIYVYKTCSHCLVAGKWLQIHCGSYCFGDIEEELVEHYDEGYREDNLQKLLIGMRRQWRSFGEEGLLPLPRIERA